MVDRGGLENRCTRKGTVGSNPTPSATLRPSGYGWRATRSPKGEGCLPKLRRSVGRLLPALGLRGQVVHEIDGAKGAACGTFTSLN